MLDFEKNVYNAYLKAIATGANRPYRKRKDFDGFEGNPKYPKVQKIASTLFNNQHINISVFFDAPYNLYKIDSGESYTLDFYMSRKGISTYKKYLKFLELQSPDSDDNLEFLRSSIGFVHRFCKEHNLTYDEYMNHSIGLTPTWMTHYFEKQISAHILMECTSIYDTIYSMDETHRKMVVGDLGDVYPTIRYKYNKSMIAPRVLKMGISRINEDKK